LFREAKAIPPNNCPVLENYAVSDTAEFADDGVRVGEKVVADLSTTVDSHETMQDGVPADDRLFVDKTIGADMCSLPDVGSLGNHGGRMDTRSVPR
jgi:hypothetical protein